MRFRAFVFFAWVFVRSGLSAGFESVSFSNPLPVAGSSPSRVWPQGEWRVIRRVVGPF
jgi:hypothetical protein